MLWNRILGRGGIAAVFAVGILCAAPAFAGGFFIFGELPTGDKDTKDAALIVSLVGCHQLGEMSAKAEGLVDGKRVSLPLRLEPLGEGRFLVKRSWPGKGVWGISVYAVSAKPVTVAGKTFLIRDAALFLCGPDGRPVPPPPVGFAAPGIHRALLPEPLSTVPVQKAEEIDIALRTALEHPATSAAGAR